MIFDGFVAILTKNVVSNVVPNNLFFCENRYKTVKLRPICIKLTVSKLQQFMIFKKVNLSPIQAIPSPAKNPGKFSIPTPF